MSGYQYQTMTDRTNWTKAQLDRMVQLKRSGLTNRAIFDAMRQEFGIPKHLGEINAELSLLSRGPNPYTWDPAMEARLKHLHAQGMDSNDITSELFHEYGKPDMWQETYRKIQQLKMQGRMA
ncbi:MAG: hypothetical protein LQ346_003502 [Caloplaca aetnensis]|nr:MAG: hypothetical protein LQ346_003502 [Caloplaca aetnensis]